MITTLRRLLETWPARILFGIMVVAFVIWGVGDVIRVAWHHTWVAKAGGDTIGPQQFQAAYEREITQAQRRLQPGQDLSTAQRRQIAQKTLDQMVANIAVTNEERRLRITVPDAAVRQAVFNMPAFRGKNGEFDRNLLDGILRDNNMTEGQFLSIVRSDLARQQLVGAVTSGASPSKALAEAVFQTEGERRSAAMVELPFAAAKAPPAPTDAELHRWYDNNPDAFRVPEFRRVRVAILSPETIAKSITVSDAELKSWFDSHRAQFQTPATRSIQVAILPDQAKAAALAAKWKSGADWAAVQKQAEADQGSAVALDKTTETQVPDDALAKAAFAATPDQVTGPVKVGLGYAVLRVTAATQGTDQSFAQAKDAVRKRLIADRASAALYDDANKVDNVLGTGVGLDKLPSDLGLAGVEGTLDQQGNTPDGKPAPIPGPDELRKAIIAAAFSHAPGPPSELTEVQTPSVGGSAFYAVQVEQITPPSRKPFDAVKDQVAQRWTQAARVHEQEVAATAILTELQHGKSLTDAAAKAGLTVRTTPLITRDNPDPGVPQQLRAVLFGLKPGEPTMVQTADGFVVAEPYQTSVPTEASDPEQYKSVEQALARAQAATIATIFADALRQRAQVNVNQPVFDSFVQQ